MPVHVGSDSECTRIAGALRADGFHVDPNVVPAIAADQCRLRFMMNAHHSRAQVDGVVHVVARRSIVTSAE